MTQEKTASKDFFGIKAKREALGMTLKDVFALTRISVVNLEAIENGKFDALPGSVYAKNFIKTYAQVLDLDSKPILAGYEAHLKSLQADQPAAPVQEREQKTTPENEEQKGQETSIKKSSSHKKVYLVIAFVIVIVVAIGITIWCEQQPVPKVAVNQPSSAVTAPALPAATNTPATPPPAAVPANLPAQLAPAGQPTATLPPDPKEAMKQVSPQPAPPQQKSTAPAKPSTVQNVPAAVEKKEPASGSEGRDVLVIKATEATWLRIKTDQNPPFQVVLKPGETIKRKGAGFAIDIGNAGGVTMQFNGKTIENLGKSGEVRHLQLP